MRPPRTESGANWFRVFRVVRGLPPLWRLLFSRGRNTVQGMSTKAQAILDEIRALPPEDLQAVWQELGRRLGQAAPTAAAELYGEPLTDEDIEESARVTFQMLDEEEKRAATR